MIPRIFQNRPTNRQKTKQTIKTSTYVDIFLLNKLVLGPLKACFDQLDQKILKNWSYLSNPCNFISWESMFHAPSTSDIKNRSSACFKAILGPLKSYFDQLDQEFLKNWSYLSNPRIFISRESMFHARSTSNIKIESVVAL